MTWASTPVNTSQRNTTLANYGLKERTTASETQRDLEIPLFCCDISTSDQEALCFFLLQYYENRLTKGIGSSHLITIYLVGITKDLKPYKERTSTLSHYGTDTERSVSRSNS